MLKDYSEKRHFDITTEPKPEVADTGDQPLTFVVQKHAASHLHYDFRLELNGVLISWAVPKGPSLNPADRRLAAKTEDHPYAYGSFEGNIPQGQYGGGEVIIWDNGTYESLKGPGSREVQVAKLNKELAEGKLEFILHGKKLKGAFVLIHTDGKQWLLKKMIDEFASTRDILAEDRSVVSNRRIGGVPDLEHVEKSSFELPQLEPMLLTEADKAFSSPDWSFELKLDGVRVLCYVNGDSIKIVTRNGNDVTTRFPQIVKQLQAMGLSSSILDGETVQFDENGLPNFQALIQPFQAGKVIGADLVIFDLLFLNGKNLTALPFAERRKILDEMTLDQVNIKRLDTFPAEGELLFEHAVKMGFEGVVGKRLSSRYQSGIRSKDWVKIKGYLSDEFVVVGFTEGDNARSKTFGALLLAERKDNVLRYVGNCGGGFTDQKLQEVCDLLKSMIVKKSPLKDDPGIKHVTWVDPKLVVEVRFTMWTRDRKLRFPIFLRARPDIDAAKVGGEVKEIEVKEQEIDPVLKVLQDLDAAKDEAYIVVEGHKIHFSSLSKELWPGVTKRDLAKYYATASGSLLKYLKDRPISFVRCPEGIQGERFFQKHYDKGRPDFVEVVSIHSDSNEGARDYIMVNNLASIVWLAQVAVLELNPWNSTITPEKNSQPSDLDFSSSRESLEASMLNKPDYLVLDLDPHFGGKASGWRRPEWERLVEVGFALKEVLDGIGIKCFPKSSGKSGLHLFVPVARIYTYDQIRAAAGTIGEQVAAKLGKKVTLEWNIKKRPDGVFIDVNQNVRGKTMAAVYSPRAATNPGVSMPLLWDELERIDPTQITVKTAVERMREKGDLWAEVQGLPQRLF